MGKPETLSRVRTCSRSHREMVVNLAETQGLMKIVITKKMRLLSFSYAWSVSLCPVSFNPGQDFVNEVSLRSIPISQMRKQCL